jgi:hypothetical protein
LLDEPHDPAGLRAHGLQLLAARRWRALGRPVPAELLADERTAAIAVLAVPALLLRVRRVLSGPIVVLKGPEVAMRYPDPGLRPLGDIDLLVPDAHAAEHTLRAAGFEPAEGEATAARHQHRPPLRWPTLPLAIEVHHALPVPRWATPPPADRLFAVALPSALGVEGILALPPAHHALVLAAHAWSHYGPRPRLRDLIDVAALAEEADPAEVAALARAWGLERVWGTTTRAVEALLPSSPSPDAPGGRMRAGLSMGERTVAEEHVVRWLGALWAPRLREIPRAMALTMGQDLLPWPGERWSTKLARLGGAAHHALLPVSEHRSRRDR